MKSRIRYFIVLFSLITLMMQSSYSFEAISSLRIHKGFIQELIDKNGMTLNNMNPFKINIDSLIDETENNQSQSYKIAFKTLRESGSGLDSTIKIIEHSGFKIGFSDINVFLTQNIDGVEYTYNCLIEEVTITAAKIVDDANKNLSLLELSIDKIQLDSAGASVIKEGEKVHDSDIHNRLDKILVSQVIKSLEQIVNKAISNINDIIPFLVFRKELENFKSLNFKFEYDFIEDYIEFYLITETSIPEEYQTLFKDNKDNLKHTKSEKGSIELLVNENLLNLALYSLFKTGFSVQLRDLLSLDDSTNKYAESLSKMFETQTLKSFWPQIMHEFGSNKILDLICNFGKNSNTNLSKEITPSKVQILNENIFKLSIGVSCKILVKTEENKWEEFRDFFIKIGSKFSFKWTHNDLTKKILASLAAELLKIENLKVFKNDKNVKEEEKSMMTVANLGLEFLKKLINSKLDKMQLKYLKFKECTGLSLLRPEIRSYDGFAVISADFDVKTGEYDCFNTKLTMIDTNEEIKENKMNKKYEIKEDL